jgi:DNA (cytosine-5)-methyltransferase 1
LLTATKSPVAKTLPGVFRGCGKVQITFGSLFAGIGGFDLGFERAGMTCQWQVEIDDYATRVLAKHWPHIHRERDIRQCGRHNLRPVDVICGGFPCQDISYAGLGAGLEGERSGLFFEAVRVVRELQPRIVVLENVAALLTRGLDTVLGTLATIGYDAEWHCIPAAAVGAPHLRDRVFIVAWQVAYDDAQYGDHAGFGTNASRGKWEASKIQRNAQSWDVEPAVGRVADGVPGVVDRLRGLGNAVVPQVAEWIGRRVVEQLKSSSTH